MSAYVARISLAPVKALGLVHPDEVELGADGVVGNRRFLLYDEDGRLYNGKRDGSVVQIRPEWDEATRRLALGFPDGERVEGIVELGDEVETKLYGLQLPSRLVRGPWQEAISRFVGTYTRPLAMVGMVKRTLWPARSRWGFCSLL